MQFAYTILYVTDVTKTVEFYEKAFGLKRRFIHEAGDYAEMETGATALTFASENAAEDNDIAIYPNRKGQLPSAWEICLTTPEVSEAYTTALEAGRPLCLRQPKSHGGKSSRTFVT